MFSTMITVPSTMMPRSMAPTDSRLADSPRATVIMTASRQRDRNRRGDDDRAAQIAEKHPLDQEDQRDAEQQIVQHGVDRDADEIAAVVERLDLDACGQRAVGIELLDRGAHALHHVHRAFKLLHQDDAGDGVGLAVAPRHADPRFEADLDVGDIRQQHRNAALLRQTILPMSSSEVMTPMPRTLADCSPIAIVRPPTLELLDDMRADDLRQRQPVGDHPVEIDLDLVFLGVAAQHRDVGNAGHDPQPPLDDPVLDRLELHHTHAGRAGELIAEDLADAARRRDHRLHARRQLHVLQPVDRLLADEMIVAAVFELQPDEAEREHRVGAREFQTRRARDRDFDRDGDVALDLFRRLAGPLRDDLDDRRRRIGIGLDVQGLERNDAPSAEEGGERNQHERTPRQAKSDETTEHGVLTFRSLHVRCR